MLEIKALLVGELEEILSISQNVGVFSKEEVATVDELFQGYLKDPVISGYNYLSCRLNGAFAGYACWGPTALSKGTVDLYWICVDKSFQNQGIAAELFRAVEKKAAEAGRWQIVIWTSSKPEYEQARRFYQKMGCVLATQITDFYDRGDDLCVYMRILEKR
jgi:GNAT superfamily N-acetyltransferase